VPGPRKRSANAEHPVPQTKRDSSVPVDLEPRLLRVQRKLAKRVGGALAIRLQTSRYTPGGYVFTSYSADEIDAVGAYSVELKSCFLLPIAEVEGMRGVHLRLDPSGNNQARGVRWANHYELEPMIRKLRTTGRPPDSLLVATLPARHSGL